MEHVFTGEAHSSGPLPPEHLNRTHGCVAWNERDAKMDSHKRWRIRFSSRNGLGRVDTLHLILRWHDGKIQGLLNPSGSLENTPSILNVATAA